ncbi:hypothetical protein BDL97_02G103200 [Sphagnum fallax]|nr:hypothetical protein BDL97_02G103200 [Sphagnum fallax]
MGSLLLALGCRSAVAVAAATVARSTPPGYVSSSSSSSSSHKHMHCVSTFVSKRSIIKLGLVPDLAAIRAPTRCRNWVPCRATGGEEEGHDQEKEALSSKEGSAKETVESTATEVTESATQGSNIAGLNKPSSEVLKLPKEVLDVLQNQVFGFDTFFVTGQEPYEEKFGEQYKLFLLINPQDDKPVAAVVPSESLEPDIAPVPEWFAAGAFGLVTIGTIILRNSPAAQINFSSVVENPALLADGLLGALVTFAVLLAHEAGHLYAAQKVGAKLGIPYLVPSWQLGSFGSITRITSIVTNRQELLQVAVTGPIAGAALGLTLVLLGLLLSPSEGQGIVVNASIFHDSFLVGGLAKLFMGSSLTDGTQVAVNPLVLSAWAGLLINSINSIPVGELDGGRISQALWGRKAWSRINGVSIALLGLSGIFNDVALYWVVLILFIQRGPIPPQADEITAPENTYVTAGVVVLLLGLLICAPLPFSF